MLDLPRSTCLISVQLVFILTKMKVSIKTTYARKRSNISPPELADLKRRVKDLSEVVDEFASDLNEIDADYKTLVGATVTIGEGEESKTVSLPVAKAYDVDYAELSGATVTVGDDEKSVSVTLPVSQSASECLDKEGYLGCYQAQTLRILFYA